MSVLDGAVLVISAVEGVQPQTPLLMRALQRLHVPTLMFVNKIDRRGADSERVLRGISERLIPAVVPMGSARNLGTRAAGFKPADASDSAFTARLASALAEPEWLLRTEWGVGGVAKDWCWLPKLAPLLPVRSRFRSTKTQTPA